MNRVLLTDEELIEQGFERNIMLKIAASAMRNNIDADVIDPHYGTTVNTDLAIAFHNGRYILVGFDSSNQIVEVRSRYDNLCNIGAACPLTIQIT